MTLSEYMANRQARINGHLANQLPHEANNLLHQAMKYAVLNGGKRLRPLLVYATGEALGAELDQLDIPACAIEFIHCYSLVHDDLPAMDNDDLRRGKPSCHKAFNEAIAILVGDALQTSAFQTLSDPSCTISAPQLIQMINLLAQAAGATGMAYGQALDIIQPKAMTPEFLTLIYQAKTGALIESSIKLGILTANYSNETTVQLLAKYAHCIGLSYQIKDDIMDIESSTEILGKQTGSDCSNEKSTYPILVGMKNAKQEADTLHHQALHYLREANLEHSMLALLTDYLMTRNK